jgi:hypothetical protein
MTHYRRVLCFLSNTGKSVYYRVIKVHYDDIFVADKYKEELKQTI